jgi:hypothetical protein
VLALLGQLVDEVGGLVARGGLRHGWAPLCGWVRGVTQTVAGPILLTGMVTTTPDEHGYGWNQAWSLHDCAELTGRPGTAVGGEAYQP